MNFISHKPITESYLQSYISILCLPITNLLVISHVAEVFLACMFDVYNTFEEDRAEVLVGWYDNQNVIVVA